LSSFIKTFYQRRTKLSKIFDTYNLKLKKDGADFSSVPSSFSKKTFADFSAKLCDEIEPRGIGVRKPQQGAGGHKFIFDRRGETCSWQVLISERTGKNE